ncbi:hypothetical protein CDO44_22805 [Pigmentiphaga sp. NML080357]|uniref:NAD(P)/FAD-dependent oxidoreductase n=1 Tax=Pigmentiphaga sp. NML080357 TaxID=2008675 RepID=UPI000B4092B5|nr:FAD-dependent oxidoreductase [Pigmentiphaga sp. NML080357]OVZ55082.1 hypothetical protein CDO44_22805 [Pigmentiphaga sp. NML080357]
MDEARTTIAILGGGHAGAAAMLRLRQLNYLGKIVLVSDEGAPPYDRPGLSKEYLLGEVETPRPLFADTLPNERVLVSTRALGIELAGRVVRTDKEDIRYDRLLVATGADARRLNVPGAHLPGIHTLRTSADAARIADSLAHCVSTRRPLLIVGGSWIGLEVAAAARRRGVDVVLLEQGERLCQRTVPASVAARLHAMHEKNGVRLRMAAQVAAFEGAARVSHARLADGTTLEVGAVVVGIGVLPNLGVAREAGLHIRQGIVIDALGRTSDPHVYAAGDVAEVPCRWQARPVRYESWSAANTQARTAAESMLHDLGRADLSPLSAPEVPWFWSDQYGKTLRLAGSPLTSTESKLLRDDEEGFLEGFFSDGRLVGIAALGHAREFRNLRSGIEPRAS